MGEGVKRKMGLGGEKIRNRGGAKQMAALLQDKIGLVTGAASGIGKDKTRAFAREGAMLTLEDL